MAPAGKKKKAIKQDSSDPPTFEPQAPTITKQQSTDSTTAKSSGELPNGSSKGWFNRNWPKKAAPVTQIARDSISSASNTAVDLASAVKTPSSLKSSKNPPVKLTRKPSRSLPVDAATTKVHAVSDPPPPSTSESVLIEGKRSQSSTKSEHGSKDTISPKEQQPVPSEPEVKDTPKSRDLNTAERLEGSESSTPGWLGWFMKSPRQDKAANSKTPSEDQVKAPEDNGAKSPPETTAVPDRLGQNGATESVRDSNDITEGVKPVTKRTWLQMFNSSAPETEGDRQQAVVDDQKELTSSTQTDALINTPESQSKPEESAVETSPPPKLPGDGKSSGWIFWSRDRRDTSSSAVTESRVGELAISDTPSQKRPKRASISLDRPPDKVSEKKSKKATTKSGEATPATPKPTKAVPPEAALNDAANTVPKEDAGATQAKASELEDASKALKKAVPNVLLPPLKETFLLQQSPGLMQQLTRLFGFTKSHEPQHLGLTKDPPRIKNALAIGVHGYFPAPFIRTVLGQPTGTSIKFADMAVKSIRKWTAARGYDCEVKSAALEGEGRIAERVDLLWKLLLNWIEEIRKSDFIFVACHSQGVPVALMLVAKLISFGCVNASRIGVCAMAGVSLGPFSDYKSRWISGSAGELFEFSNPNSTVSKNYLAALETCLAFGVRVVYTGSMDDQLVSLESSTFSPVSHPHIYRAVFVDGRVHSPNFLANLVGFALKLRNLGVPDHGLIRELSSPMAGSLYSGEGHSRIYEEEGVYDLAVEFALETTSSLQLPLTQRPTTPSSPNPYILPFAMRGVLEEEYVRTELYTETRELLKQFDDWKPSSKVLKDVKFRLEGIRSKL
ncbi:MAG: hypothetical protein Q9227_009457 [Pyrenula ochraceoflavens]